jgi:GTPase SAR1 family protein
MVTTNVRKNYEAFLEKRNILIDLIDRQIFLLSSLSIDTWVETLQRLNQRVSSDTFKVLIVGEFKRGKSTFINAMLGQDILPAYSTPCTAIINEVKWGESPGALLHYLKIDDGSKLEPEKIPVEAIEEYVVIPEGTNDNYINPYEKVEIFYPLELCRSGVEVIDSPGLNEHTTRSQVTEGYLPIVDAIIFVFTCEALASQSEIRFIETYLKNLGHEDLFFVCNKFDQIKEKEKDRVKKFAISKLAPLTQRGESGVFFISALDALEGRLSKDEERVTKSSVPILEHELELFLTNDRGRLKILEPAKDLQEAIKAARQTVPERKAMLETSREELEKRFQDAQEPLKQLQVKREQIETRISNFCDDIRRLVFDKTYLFYGDLPKKVEAWVREYEPKNTIDFTKINPLKIKQLVKAPVEAIVNELKEHLSNKLEDEFIPWQEKELQPFISSRTEDLKLDIDARASEFIRTVDELRSQLAVGKSSTLTQETISGLERLLLSAGVSTANSYEWTRGVLGLGSRKVSDALWTSVFWGTTLVGISALFPPAALILGVVLLIGIVGGEIENAGARVEQKIKEETSKKFAEELRKSARVQADHVANEVCKKLLEIKQAVDQGLSKELKNIEDQVQSVLAEKEKGQASVAQKVRELGVISESLKKLEEELDDLINQLTLL